MSKRSVAILGQASTAALAPFDDPAWEIWALGWVFGLPRADLRFDIHHPDFKEDEKYKGHINSMRWEPKYPKWVKDHKLPMICATEATELFGGTPYPLDEVRALFPGRDVLECTISYMLAYAIWQKREHIGIWGCHFCGCVEYLYQLPSVTYLIGYADAKGIKVDICPGGPLMASGYNEGRYGINHDVRRRFEFP